MKGETSGSWLKQNPLEQKPETAPLNTTLETCMKKRWTRNAREASLLTYPKETETVKSWCFYRTGDLAPCFLATLPLPSYHSSLLLDGPTSDLIERAASDDKEWDDDSVKDAAPQGTGDGAPRPSDRDPKVQRGEVLYDRCGMSVKYDRWGTGITDGESDFFFFSFLLSRGFGFLFSCPSRRTHVPVPCIGSLDRWITDAKVAICTFFKTNLVA